MTALDPTARVAASPAPAKRSKAAAYLALTKPRIIELLLVTTVPVMFLAHKGVPSLWLIVATLVGGALSAGAANTFNCVYDRDIDAEMHRTSNRPMVTGEVSPREGLVFGVVLTVLSTVWFLAFVNVLSAALSLGAIVMYAVGYTMLLKRRTRQNIVWGGAAGCMPVLIGWSAVANSVSWSAVMLFLVIFFWTPPHYWPLSMKFKDDYAAAHVPMLPVVERFVVVARQIVAYSWAMVVASLALVWVNPMGWLYLVTAVVTGGFFLAEAYRLLRAAKAGAGPTVLKPMRLFHFSISYVAILFLGVALDPLFYLSVTGR
ncbi:heme o synthase [Phycicoccus sp. 3266]|uniref:heme o synthase n=1 Tax=Phycicoccus sp. 3266 TaxID=2817751 RepID=UPI002859694F|nr:heme o synthase [Phycicoccus sp. 3266]MDR6865072.1 protoheme IX farnesyltransferase [Phycicoccus sp. 3266]